MRGVRQYLRKHCRFLTVKNLPPIEECVIELSGVLVLVYSDFMYISGMCI